MRLDESVVRSDAARNREQLTRAAIVVLHREGATVPMAAIAAEAGVGVGTLYRHFPTREVLLDELVLRSFERMLTSLRQASDTEASAVAALRTFLRAVVADRDELVLPSTGGPAVRTPQARAAQRELHGAITALIERGAADGTIVREVDVWDVAWLGATLAPPGRPGRSWPPIAHRLLETYLAGLGVRG